MRAEISRWALLIPLGLALGCSSSSQQDTMATTPAPVEEQSVTYTYSIPSGEFVRVPLEGGATYRAELDGSGFRLQVRPVESGTQDPLVQELVPGVGASGTAIFSVKPRVDGVYEFRSLAGDPARPMTLRLTRERNTAKQ